MKHKQVPAKNNVKTTEVFLGHKVIVPLAIDWPCWGMTGVHCVDISLCWGYAVLRYAVLRALCWGYAVLRVRHAEYTLCWGNAALSVDFIEDMLFLVYGVLRVRCVEGTLCWGHNVLTVLTWNSTICFCTISTVLLLPWIIIPGCDCLVFFRNFEHRPMSIYPQLFSTCHVHIIWCVYYGGLM